MSADSLALILAASDPCSTCTAEGADVLLFLMWASVVAVAVAYLVGVYAFAEAMKGDVILREPDCTVARWAIGIVWPVFGLFRFVEFLAKLWRAKSWP